MWATLRLIDACLALSPEQLNTGVPGTYGSILETVSHLVGTDSWDLFVASDESAPPTSTKIGKDLAELRAAMERHAAAWSSLLAREPGPDALRREVDEDDGYTRGIPMAIELAQTLHHGMDQSEPGLHRPHEPRRGTAGHRRYDSTLAHLADAWYISATSTRPGAT